MMLNKIAFTFITITGMYAFAMGNYGYALSDALLALFNLYFIQNHKR